MSRSRRLQTDPILTQVMAQKIGQASDTQSLYCALRKIKAPRGRSLLEGISRAEISIALSHPIDEQGISDREHHRPDEQADYTKREEAADDTREHKQ